MTPSFHFAVLTAVSSERQAREDKASLEDQLKTSRAFGLREGGIETSGPYVLDGYSRSAYEGLAEAAADIPPLQNLLDELTAKKFNVLIMDNFDRLGDIAPMLNTRFKKHNAQLVSARQSGSVIPADQYDPHRDEASEINMHVEAIIQAYRINKIRRGWKTGIPARIDKGLHPLCTNYGYQRAGEDLPAIQVPEQAALLIQMKDWMLSGLSYAEIARRSDGILTPLRAKHWHPSVIKNMLIKPYYAGNVRFGRHKKRVPTPPSEWREGQGKHQPLWDEATHHAILAEAARRLEGKRNFNARYPLTGLTVCGICGGKIGRHGKIAWKYLSCEKSSHWHMHYDSAIDYISNALVDELKRAQSMPARPMDITPLKTRLDDIASRRARIHDGYENGLYTSAEASAKLSKLDADAAKLSRSIEQAQQHERTRDEWKQRLGDLQKVLQHLPNLIKNDDPVRINQLLAALIQKIVLFKNEIQFVWQE